MTERERWVVYPLLFLALGAALRDKLVDRTTAKSIICQELTVVDEEPDGHQPSRILAKIGRSQDASGAGILIVNGQVLVDGTVNANVFNGKQYALQDVVFAPPLPAFGISLPDVLRAMQAAPGRQPAAAPKENPPPPAKPPANAPENTSPEKSNADSAGPAKE